MRARGRPSHRRYLGARDTIDLDLAQRAVHVRRGAECFNRDLVMPASAVLTHGYPERRLPFEVK
jgi:hypothetical protein